MKKTILRVWDDFVSLLFPRLCLACEQPLPYDEPFICLDCQLDLPQTDFHKHKINAFTERFEGRLSVRSATALYYFTKHSKTQHLIHKIKYHDKREAAITLGFMLGNKLLESLYFKNIDYIIPVPMHADKELRRGYNQADFFARGISESMDIPVLFDVLKKIKKTDTQTHKSRLERFNSVEDAFVLNTPSVVEGKNVLIVDDVMTTGATLEACAQTILKTYPDVKISFATIAYSRQ
jgi:ComF family protein